MRLLLGILLHRQHPQRPDRCPILPADEIEEGEAEAVEQLCALCWHHGLLCGHIILG